MTAHRDLFGPLPVGARPQGPTSGKRKGYAAPPGSGPAGETCGTCAHHVRRRWSKVHHKCGLMRNVWNNARGTDILVRSPACSRWEKDDG